MKLLKQLLLLLLICFVGEVIALLLPISFPSSVISMLILFILLLTGALMSAGIEFFQVTHGMAFDLGDVLTNSIGTAAGCVVGLPATLVNGWIYNRRRRRGKR